MRTARSCTQTELRHDSKGDGLGPRSLYQGNRSDCMNRKGPSTAPATDVECPLTNLVSEWTTKSAPRRKGCCRYGEHNVLSTTSGMPRASVSQEVRRMSATFRVGFSGDSTYTTATSSFSSSARCTEPRSEVSQKTALTPNLWSARTKLSVAP